MRKASIVFCFLFCSIALLAQESEMKRGGIVSDGLYFSPIQLVFPEIILTYEHFYDGNKSLSYSLGYKIPVGKGNTIEPFGGGLYAVYEYQYLFNKFSNAIYASLAPTYYFRPNRKHFVKCELFNRYYWFDNKRLSFDNVETDKFNSIRSERVNVTGIKMLAGVNSNIFSGKSTCLNVKFYSGFGIRYKVYQYENVDNIISDGIGGEVVIPYEKELGSLFILSFHLGLKIGIAKNANL
ncbi:MAG: hypothetical protein K9H64_14305 [Bacteroidales bacterium]|nr:hypothetical protein [Bacteroidales bacterium]MCF8457139.1 hypothetical protein [Bacteroidales bacterium]